MEHYLQIPEVKANGLINGVRIQLNDYENEHYCAIRLKYNGEQIRFHQLFNRYDQLQPCLLPLRTIMYFMHCQLIDGHLSGAISLPYVGTFKQPNPNYLQIGNVLRAVWRETGVMPSISLMDIELSGVWG